MPLWSNTDNAAGAPKWKSIATGSSTPNRGNTLFGNTTPSAFINNIAVGVFGANTTEAAAFPGNGTPGWVKTTVGTGPAVAIIVSGGVGFANGETLTLSNGSSNATAVITTNNAGNASFATITTGGSGFVNTAMVARTFSRERYTSTIANSTGGTAAGNFGGDVTRINYTNGNIVTVTGGVLAIANSSGGNGTSAFFIAGANGYVNSNIITISGPNVLVNAVANISSTNSTGGNVALTIIQRGSLANGTVNQAFTYTISNTGLGGGLLGNTSVSIFANSIVQTVFVPSVLSISTNATGGNIALTIVQRGLFTNTTVNQAFTYTISNTGLGTGLLGNTSVTIFGNTIVANSSGGTAGTVTLGGRAGRVQREPLVVMRTIP